MKPYLIASLALALAGPVKADTPAPIHFNVIGGGSHNYTFGAVEKPF